jgi:hypothetical protein
MCSIQVESKTRLSRRQLGTITCFGCKKEIHRILTCSNFQVEPHCTGRTGQTGMDNWSDWSISGLASQEKMEISFKGPIASRARQGLLEAKQR